MRIPKFGENLLQCFGSLAAIVCSICGNGEDAGNERSTNDPYLICTVHRFVTGYFPSVIVPSHGALASVKTSFQRPELGTLYAIELATNLREDFTIIENG